MLSEHKEDDNKGLLDRACCWLAHNVMGRHHALLQVEIKASAGVGRFNKSIKSHWSGAYSFYRVRPDEIGFTGSKEMYQIVKKAIEESGLRYKLRYFGTRITARK